MCYGQGGAGGAFWYPDSRALTIMEDGGIVSTTRSPRKLVLSCAAAVMACAVGATLLLPGAMAAEKAFTGEDAAYVDWAWKNCEFVSTKKEHDLVSQAAAAKGDAFQRGYELQYRRIIDGTPATEVRRTCEAIMGWYGPVGTRITELIDAKEYKAPVAGTSIGPKSPPQPNSAASNSGKRGGIPGR